MVLQHIGNLGSITRIHFCAGLRESQHSEDRLNLHEILHPTKDGSVIF